jgi:hypothetical protein
MYPTSSAMLAWPYPEPGDVRQVMRYLGSAFYDLPLTITSNPLFKVINIIKEITIGYDNWTRQCSPCPSLERILWARNSVQHDLLCLPDKSSQVSNSPTCIYEVCRLGTMAYMLLVLFPVPRIAHMHPRLGRRLMTAINSSDLLGLWDHYASLLLWATILGGIVSENHTRLRQQYLAMSAHAQMKQTLRTWPLVKEICARHLWLDLECDEAGKAFWLEASFNELT